MVHLNLNHCGPALCNQAFRHELLFLTLWLQESSDVISMSTSVLAFPTWKLGSLLSMFWGLKTVTDSEISVTASTGQLFGGKKVVIS